MRLIDFATYLYNKPLYYDIKNSLEFQYKPIDEIRKIQNRKFKDLINHAKHNVPYYKGKLDGVHDISDLHKISFLTKEKINKNNHLLKSVNLNEDRFAKNSTSGSTGKSMNFFSDTKNFNTKAATVRGNSWAGLRYGEKVFKLWGAERDIEKNKSLYKKMKHNYLEKIKVFSTYHMSKDDMDNYIQEFNRYKPVVVISYPTPLYHLATHVKNNNIKIWKPKGIVTSSETLFPFQRELIEQIFSAKIFNRYGSREFGHIAAECNKHDGLHINADRLIVEVINKNGEVCAPGELGELAITDLDNYAFPFIRYKIKDMGILSDTPCSCGINLPLLKSIEGRVFDLIVGSNGNVVAGTFFTLLRNKIEGMRKFQIIQNDKSSLNVVLENNALITEGFKNKLREIIKSKLGKDMIVNIDVVDSIEPTGSGKHRWIISNISPYV